MTDYKKFLEELLTATAQNGASDLHCSPGNYPVLRIDDRLITLSNQPILDNSTLEGLASEILGDRKQRFVSEKELDFAFQSNTGQRFRVHTYQTMGGYAVTMRLVPGEIRTPEELQLPPIVKIFSKLSQGLVLVVGPNGHGKSTTLASLINEINKERAEKIITIEDPIEYIFSPNKSIIDQREVYRDTLSFNKALRSTFRENADVIMIGELRDYETMSTAVRAAETGHLVLSSIHTNSASQTIERIIDSFPPNQQMQIRSQLANTLSGIVSQRLIPRIQGGLIPAVEVMIATSAVRNLVRENKPRQIDLVIETGQEVGMISMDRSLADLVRRKEITLERAEFYSSNPQIIRNHGI
ncbi:PilT/PilU family type 4a pilus ATPase [Candidatus Parcubacteria bacterium]|nr:PilT/PilU family type 4a pilus ATPase [Candidatus Parcubacteria bacterium]